MTTAFEDRVQEAVEELVGEAVVSERAFAEIERRIAGERPGVHRPVLRLAAAAAVVAVLAVAVAVRSGGPNDGSVASGFERLTFDFEAGPTDTLEPVGWEPVGRDAGYQIRATDDRSHAGRWAGRVALVGRPVIDGAGGLRRCLPGSDAAGRQVRLTGHAATDGVTGDGASLSLDAYDEAGKLVAYGGSSSAGGLTGTNDFTALEVVVDLPSSIARLCLEATLAGGGTAWFDDLSLEVVGAAPTKGADGGRPVRPFPNLGFEGGVASNGAPVGWSPSGWPAYRLETTAVDPYRGATAGRLRSDQTGYDAAGYALACSNAPEWLRPGRIEAAAWLRPTGVTDGVAYLKLTAHALGEGLVAEARAGGGGIAGTGPWQRQDVSLDVPDGAMSICVQVVLTGAGAVDLDEVEVRRSER